MDTRASDQIAEELAALRRVAVLVARGPSPEQVFTAVTAEAGRLLDADLTAMARYHPDRAITYVAHWSAADGDWRDDLHMSLGGRNVSTLVYQTGRRASTTSPRPRDGPPTWSAGSASARVSARR